MVDGILRDTPSPTMPMVWMSQDTLLQALENFHGDPKVRSFYNFQSLAPVAGHDMD